MRCFLTTNVNIFVEKIRRGGKNATSSPRQCIRATKPAYLQKVDWKWDEPCYFFQKPFARKLIYCARIKKIYLKSNTRQENFRTFEERDILNGINSDQLPAEKTSLHGIVLPVKSLCPSMLVLKQSILAILFGPESQLVMITSQLVLLRRLLT